MLLFHFCELLPQMFFIFLRPSASLIARRQGTILDPTTGMSCDSAFRTRGWGSSASECLEGREVLPYLLIPFLLKLFGIEGFIVGVAKKNVDPDHASQP
jgi:hypothetical protein